MGRPVRLPLTFCTIGNRARKTGARRGKLAAPYVRKSQQGATHPAESHRTAVTP